MRPTPRTRALIAQLAAGIDLDRILRELKLSPAQAMQLLNSAAARRLLAERRSLAKIHTLLVANRFTAFATQRLCELLQSEKPDLRLRGAISVLNVAGLSKGKIVSKKRGKGAGGEGIPDDLTGEDMDLIEAITEALRGRAAGKKTLRLEAEETTTT